MRRLLPLALFLLLPSAALADIAPPPVESLTCPRGAVGYLPTVDPEARDPLGRPARAWPYCAPSTCESDADCDGGRVCSEEEIGLCVVALPEGETGRPHVRERGCEPDGTCLNIESTCERARRCVTPEAADEAADEPADAPAAADAPVGDEPASADEPAAEAPEAPAASGCACRAAPGRSAPPLALLGLALALVVRRR